MNLSWGTPRIFVKDIDNDSSTWVEVNTPVEGSAELQPTEGEKLEAPIEGGDNEDVRYKDTTYAFVYNVRKAKGRTLPISSKNGVASHHYALMLQPEDPENIGFYMHSTSVAIRDTFTAADGAIWQISHDALAAVSGNTVKWGTVAVTTGQSPTITFTETQPADGSTAITVAASAVTVLS